MVFEFLGKPFVERENGGFAGRVICEARDTNVGCCAGDGDDVAFVGRDHGGQEGFGRIPVAEDVDVEDLAEVSVWGIQDSVGGEDASVVDEDGGRAQCSLYLLSDSIYGFRVGDVAFEVLDVRICITLISSTSSRNNKKDMTYSPANSQVGPGCPELQP
jgi:hypothetical protein